ncbi:pre-toxin TG domain-containing protein [Lysinibacillus sp. NPDC095746]|uniref:pre-toxin TG domain-containing protein n=1 Tax=Lysinibacillus sp. NPDC095746 TaxID=3364134 RepID=UPI0038147605
MAKKGKGFFGAVGSFLGSIPVVKKVKKAAKSVKKKIKKAKKKLKKALKNAKKKLKKKLGKVLTKARKLKNNLSKSKLVKRIKKAVKKAVKKAKKYVKKVVKTVKKAVKTAVKAVKKAAKTTVKAVKKAVKTTVKAVKTAAKATVKAVKTATKAAVKAVKSVAKTVVLANKKDVKVVTKKANKAVTSIGQKLKYTNLEKSCPVSLKYTNLEKSCPVSNNYEQQVKKPGIFLKLLSLAVDFIPYVGNVKAGFEAYEGYDPITMEELDPTDRKIATAGIILGGIAKIGKGAKIASDLLFEGKNATNVAETAANSSKNTTTATGDIPKGTGKGGSSGSLRDFREAKDQDKKLIDDVFKKYNAGKRKNVAVTKGEINGEKIDLESVSGKIDPANPNHKDNFSKPSENHYKYSGSDKNGRLNDTEQKMIEHLREKYKDTPNVNGNIEIISHKAICQSCNDIIDQFQKDFPNINITRVQILDE